MCGYLQNFDTLILKCKEPTAQTLLKKIKYKVGGLESPENKIYHKVPIKKTVWHTLTKKLSRIQSIEADSRLSDHLLDERCGRAGPWEKEGLCRNGAGTLSSRMDTHACRKHNS